MYRHATRNMLMIFAALCFCAGCLPSSTTVPRPDGWSETVTAAPLPGSMYDAPSGCGGIYTRNALIATHPSLPCGRLIRIDYKNRFAVVRVGGHWTGDGVALGLTEAAAEALEIDRPVKVKITAISENRPK